MVQYPAFGMALWRSTVLEAAALRARMLSHRRTAAENVAHLLCEHLARQSAVGIDDSIIPQPPKSSWHGGNIGRSHRHFKGAPGSGPAVEGGALNEGGGSGGARPYRGLRRSLSRHAQAVIALGRPHLNSADAGICQRPPWCRRLKDCTPPSVFSVGGQILPVPIAIRLDVAPRSRIGSPRATVASSLLLEEPKAPALQLGASGGSPCRPRGWRVPANQVRQGPSYRRTVAAGVLGDALKILGAQSNVASVQVEQLPVSDGARRPHSLSVRLEKRDVEDADAADNYELIPARRISQP